MTWRNSTYSNAGNECVEISQSGCVVLIRDSKSPAAHLQTSRAAWSLLIRDLKRSG